MDEATLSYDHLPILDVCRLEMIVISSEGKYRYTPPSLSQASSFRNGNRPPLHRPNPSPPSPFARLPQPATLLPVLPLLFPLPLGRPRIQLPVPLSAIRDVIHPPLPLRLNLHTSNHPFLHPLSTQQIQRPLLIEPPPASRRLDVLEEPGPLRSLPGYPTPRQRIMRRRAEDPALPFTIPAPPLQLEDLHFPGLRRVVQHDVPLDPAVPPRLGLALAGPRVLFVGGQEGSLNGRVTETDGRPPSDEGDGAPGEQVRRDEQRAAARKEEQEDCGGSGLV